jgi:hypothetical protein
VREGHHQGPGHAIYLRRPFFVHKIRSLGRAMKPKVQVGTILIEERPVTARILGPESEPYSGKWSVIKALDDFALDRKIHASGWSFLFMTAEVRVMFFGDLGAKKIQKH